MTTRRRFLEACGYATAGAAATSLPFVFAQRAAAATFGPLQRDPANILDLPAGFSYRILQRAGATMEDGYKVPTRPDGMACFAGALGTWVLMRNHELTSSGGAYPRGTAPLEAYDADAVGGVTRVVLDASTGDVISSNLVLTGTVRNCAGGMSPWGWLSCEENVSDGHGYVFICDLDASSVQRPQRIVPYGRFNHEAVAINPANLAAYLTEDQGSSALYRFVPDDITEPFLGQLQAMRVGRGRAGFNTSTMSAGDVVDIDWVDIDDPDPATDSVRMEAFAAGAAIVRRGEGIWFDAGVVYVCSTSGGPVGGGQIFALRDGATGGQLEALAVSTDRNVLDMPDNITVAPWGDVFLAEDGAGEQFLRILEPNGDVSDFARNAISNSELAGVCFSPDGSTLFVNIQGDGLTIAVTGPFPKGSPLPDGGMPDGGGIDSGPGADAGVDSGTRDAGVALDAAVVDSGGGDFGAQPDFGAQSDFGNQSDLGRADLGRADASVMPADDGGCGCTTAGVPSFNVSALALGALAGVVVGRRAVFSADGSSNEDGE